LYARVVDASTTTFANNWVVVNSSDAVNSVFGRTGTVVAANGDYTASQVTNVPAGDISAVTVQAALDELDVEKVSLVSLAATTATNGASLVGIQDAGNLITATTVEGALAELADRSLDLVSLSGVADGAVNLGTFTGATIADDVTVKAALQALETAVEAAGTTTLADGNIYVGNASNVATGVALSGDATITNAGVLTVVAATDAIAGKVELATDAEVATGTDTVRAVTPASLAANYTLTTSLAATTAANGASLIGVEDAGANYVATNVEGVLTEIAGKLLSVSAVQTYTDSNVTVQRSIDANGETLQSLADVVGTLIQDLRVKGIVA